MCVAVLVFVILLLTGLLMDICHINRHMSGYGREAENDMEDAGDSACWLV